MTRTGECVYCGVVAALTDDHVPPKNLFPKPRPSNLVTVLSCRKCNAETSRDDEYFRLALTMRDDAGEDPTVQQLLPVVARSLSKPRKIGFRRSFFRSIGDVEVRTPAGVILGSRKGYRVDLTRLERVVRRTALGLFYHHRSSRLPLSYQMVALASRRVAGFRKEQAEKLRQLVLEPLWAVPEKSIGNNVFSYRHVFLDTDPNESAWLMVFFGRVSFVCFSGKPREPSNKGKSAG